MQNQIPKLTLQSDVEIQTRRAQSVNPQFAEAIREVLKTNNEVIACYLLDARKPDSDEIIQIIALTVENEAKDIDFVSQKLWEMMLEKFPDRVATTYIMSSATFKERYSGFEFYVRSSANSILSRLKRTVFKG